MKSIATAAKGGHHKANGRAEALGSNSEIGRKLKQYYDELISEEVPERFSDLLGQLEKREQPAPAREGE